MHVLLLHNVHYVFYFVSSLESLVFTVLHKYDEQVNKAGIQHSKMDFISMHLIFLHFIFKIRDWGPLLERLKKIEELGGL